jgi:hypothetical protein
MSSRHPRPDGYDREPTQCNRQAGQNRQLQLRHVVPTVPEYRQEVRAEEQHETPSDNQIGQRTVAAKPRGGRNAVDAIPSEVGIAPTDNTKVQAESVINNRRMDASDGSCRAASDIHAAMPSSVTANSSGQLRAAFHGAVTPQCEAEIADLRRRALIYPARRPCRACWTKIGGGILSTLEKHGEFEICQNGKSDSSF